MNRRAPVAIRLIQNNSDPAQTCRGALFPTTKLALYSSVRQNVLWNQGGKVTE